MNRNAIALLGGVAGLVAASLLIPTVRRRLAAGTRRTGERLRATPLVASGQEVARQVAGRAKAIGDEVAHAAQAAMTVGRAPQRRKDATLLAAEAAQKALDAVDELVRRTQEVMDEVRTRPE